MFVDKVSVKLFAGKGGDGFVSFRHEKFVDRGGPDGGDGGSGGDIIAVASNRQNTLAAFRYKKELFADNGMPGAKRKKRGASANSLKIELPVGTVITSEKKVIADLTHEGQSIVLANGGKGGFGNAHFVSSRRQAPRVAEKGDAGEEVEAQFELKMIADIGLVGLPNAGKSTLLSKISNAHPTVADYPFTTLVPQLGVVDFSQNQSFLVADIPGLIEGASQGKGLGDDFLRHIERTKVLVHLIDAYNSDVVTAYRTIMDELKAYRVDLSKRPQIIAITKTEGLPEDMVKDILEQLKNVIPKKTQIFTISSRSGEGLKQLLTAMQSNVATVNERYSKKQKTKKPKLKILKLKDTSDSWTITKKGKKYLIRGEKIERFARRTDFENPAGVERLRDIMRKMGIMHALERKKINPGDSITIGKDSENNFTY